MAARSWAARVLVFNSSSSAGEPGGSGVSSATREPLCRGDFHTPLGTLPDFVPRIPHFLRHHQKLKVAESDFAAIVAKIDDGTDYR